MLDLLIKKVCFVSSVSVEMTNLVNALNKDKTVILSCFQLAYLIRESTFGIRRLFTSDQGPVSRKSRELFGPEKPFVKLRPAYSVKLVFSYSVEGIKINITAKFRASRRLHFEDTKRIMSPDLRPKSFGTFEKQAPVVSPVEFR